MTNWIVSSSVSILAIIFLRHICKGKISLRWQYALWLLVAVRLLTPLNFGESILSIENLTAKITEQSQAKSAIQMSEQWPADINYAGFYDEVIEKYTSERNLATEIEMNELSNENSFLAKMYHVCMVIWVAGVILFSVTFIVTNWLFGARIKRNRIKMDVAYSPLPVYLSEAVETPCLFGILGTKIYVTKSVAETPVLLKHTIYHEMTHYKHADQLWSLVRCICLVLHWYNPLVWWAASLSKRDAEFACDEAVIHKLGEDERTEYGKTLIRLTCEKSQNILRATTTMASGKKSINERILLIAEKPHVRKYAFVLALVASIVIAGSTFTEAKAEPMEEVEFGIGQPLENIDWEEIKAEIGEEEHEALEKYQIVLEGGQIMWTHRKTSGGTIVQCESPNGWFSIQEYMDEKMERMELEVDEIKIESFLFADVFQSGELNVCLLVRHIGKSWIILHEENGVIYGIEVSAFGFKGVQEEGIYYAAGGRGIQYYEKMTFIDGDCEMEQVGIMSNGQLHLGGKLEWKRRKEQWEQANMSEEVAIYTLIHQAE